MNEIILRVYDTNSLSVDSLKDLPNLLSEDIEDFSRFKTDTGKREKAVSAYFKRKYIGSFTLDENKKPIADNIYFNVSHSNGVVAFAKYIKPIGVDIEHIKSKNEDIKDFVLSDTEKELVKSDEDFFSIWVSKESLIKCIGTGLKKDVKAIPSIPVDGKKVYEGKTFYSHLLKINESVVSITVEDDDFEITTIVEDIKLWSIMH